MTKKRLLFAGADDRLDLCQRAAVMATPALELVPYRAGMTLGEFSYLLVWRPVPGLAAAMPDLKVVFGLGAGVEKLVSDSSIPAHLPLVRMVEPGLRQGMVEYVLWRVLYHHRRMWELEEAQAEARWAPHFYPAAWDRKVGILGLGELGQAAARKLVEFDFQVRGWSRSSKSVAGVESFAGPDQLDVFLAGLETLVCLLPLTPDTRGILNAGLFAKLAPMASIINAARGGHLIEEDLLAALENGQVGSASLDVFQQEPLPENHPFWKHPRVFMTPHNASLTIPDSALTEIARQIERFERGEALEHMAERQRGY